MTDERLAEIKARLDAVKFRHSEVELWGAGVPVSEAALYAHSHDDIPELIVEVERLRAELRERCVTEARIFNLLDAADDHLLAALLPDGAASISLARTKVVEAWGATRNLLQFPEAK